MNSLDNKSTHVKGLLGEIEFIRHFLKSGWNIYKPFDQNCRADLLIEKENKFKKIQIKYCTPYKGVLRVELIHPGKNRKPYCASDIDAIGVFDAKNENFYLIPLNDILPKQEIWIRVDKPANKQERNINWAEKYKI
jgi:hypothetical protein